MTFITYIFGNLRITMNLYFSARSNLYFFLIDSSIREDQTTANNTLKYLHRRVGISVLIIYNGYPEYGSSYRHGGIRNGYLITRLFTQLLGQVVHNCPCFQVNDRPAVFSCSVCLQSQTGSRLQHGIFVIIHAQN